MGNLFEGLPQRPTSDEVVHLLADIAGTRVERIVSFGHTTDWYDQDADEWVAVLTGEAVLEFADGTARTMGPGDYELLPRHRQHRVAATAQGRPTVWLAVLVG